jgi:signal peptidase I
MMYRRSFLLGVCASGVPAAAIAGPTDLLSSLKMSMRFSNAGIPSRSFSVGSQSLQPTLRVGDVVLADLRPAGQRPIRGELVVYRSRDGKTESLKRVIGLPGETIAMVDGRVAIDGIVTPREPLPAYAFPGTGDESPSVPRYRETLPGNVFYEIVEVAGDNGILDRTAGQLVPEGACFVMGDNRDNSLDSRDRSVGFVPFSDIVGRVVYRMRPDPLWLVAESSVPGL